MKLPFPIKLVRSLSADGKWIHMLTNQCLKILVANKCAQNLVYT